VAASGYKNVVELGAGTAPITRVLAKDDDLKDVKLIVCDDQPDVDTYAALENQYSDQVVAKREPINFSEPQNWPNNTLLVLSGTCHHLPHEERLAALKTITDSGDRVMVCEPLRKSIISMGFVFGSLIPAIVLPIRFLNRPGKVRRLVWCWLVPVAPLMFCWDGWISCLRMWSDKEWQANLRGIVNQDRPLRVSHSLFCQMVTW
jgi:hypothetical protein